MKRRGRTSTQRTERSCREFLKATGYSLVVKSDKTPGSYGMPDYLALNPKREPLFVEVKFSMRATTFKPLINKLSELQCVKIIGLLEKGFSVALYTVFWRSKKKELYYLNKEEICDRLKSIRKN